MFGGGLPERGRGITTYTIEGCQDKAFLSMNEKNVVLAEVRNGDRVQSIPIEEGSPFALAFPRNAGDITFYDAEGQVVPY